MKRILQAPPLRVLLLLISLLTLAGVRQAQASHAQAGQLTYTYVGTTAFPNRYRIQMDFFRDCSGITPGTTTVNCRANGCNGTLVTGNLTQVGQIVTGAPYCPSIQATVQCNSSATLSNYQIYTYQCTVDLPPAAEWVISFEESARPTVANISAGTLRLEATLNNLITPIGGGTPQTIVNSSPIFSTANLPVPFVYVNDPTTISFSATDTDLLNGGRGDSLVYSLDRPLNGCGTYETYLPNTSPLNCVPVVLPSPPNPNPCILFCNLPAGGLFGPTLPLPVTVDTVGNCPIKTVQPRFNFNSQAGSFSFTPSYWNPNVTNNFNAGNKYAVVGKVTEYRRIGGRYYKVGSVRRDFLVIVVQGAGNTVPSNPGGTVGPVNSGGNLTNNRDTTQITIRTCNYTRVRFTFTDPNNTAATPNAQTLRVFTDPNLNPVDLQGGDIGSFVVTRDGTATPVGTFYFQPAASAAGTILTTTIRIEDDACPIKGVQYRTIVIRIVAGQTAQALASGGTGLPGSASGIPSICPGGSVTLQGNVNRPDSVRVVAANSTVLQTYNYQWTAINNNGLPTVTNTRSIVVSPTVTTRYRLRIDPQYGFGSTGTCGDTTSILVRVVPNPVAAITRPANTAICAGAPVVLAGRATRSDNLIDSYTYRWTAKQATAGSTQVPAGTTATINVNPTVTTRYYFTATGITQYGCRDTTSVLVTVVPAPTVVARTSNAYVCAGGTATLSVTATPAPNFTDTYTYQWAAVDASGNVITTNTGLPATTTTASITVTPTQTTRYRVTATGNVATACVNTAFVTVNVVPVLAGNFTSVAAGVNGNSVSKPPVDYTFTNTTVATLPAGATATYVWTYQRTLDVLGNSVGDAAVTFSNSATTATQRFELAGTYRILLTTTVSIAGTTCTPSTKELIIVIPDLEVPNIITPNGDNKNETFRISTAGTASKLEIYNRWGRKIKEYTNYQNDWNGDNQPAGLYYYFITDRNGAKTKGWLEIVR